MAAQGKKKELSLDTNILFDLAAEEDFAHTFREAYQERGYSLRIPPTVVQELSFYAFERRCNESQLALKALKEMRGWRLDPYDLRAVGHGITEQFSNCLIRDGLLPEGEFNDGLILAETALAYIPVLATSDSDLLDIEDAILRVRFEHADLSPVQVFHPKRLLKAITPR